MQLWRTRGGQTSASPSLACRRPRDDHSKLPSNESKRGVNPTHTEPQPDTAGGNTTGGKQHRGETAHGETHPPTKSISVEQTSERDSNPCHLQVYISAEVRAIIAANKAAAEGVRVRVT